MRCWTDPHVHTMVLQWASQTGKTEIILNGIGRQIDQDPCPILKVYPTLERADEISKERLAPMIRDTPVLRGKVSDPASRSSDNTIRRKEFPGGYIAMVGANAPAGLAARPVRIAVADEIDRFPLSAGTEGDPIALIRRRQANFWNRFLVLASSPTVKDQSRIAAALATSDERHFWVPCPSCGHSQTLVWAQVQWDDPAKPFYKCEACPAEWNDAQRLKAVSRGEWRAQRDFNGIAGFSLSTLYSPWAMLHQIVADFLVSKDDPEQLKVFVNTILNQLWEPEGTKVESASLLSHREPYTVDDPPQEILVITAGVDVQDDRVELEIVGWGRGEESWSLDYQVIYGDLSTAEPWDELKEVLLNTRYDIANLPLPITAACVDSGGHYTDEVYKFCKPLTKRRIWATKGMWGEGKPIWPGQPSRNNRLRCALFILGVDTAKETIYSRYRILNPGPGYNHFPDSYTDQHFEGLTAERCVTKYHKGQKRKEWQRRSARLPNEPLDCRVYAYAALKGLNPKFDTIAAKRQRRLDNERAPAEPVGDEREQRRPKRRRRRRRRKGGWMQAVK